MTAAQYIIARGPQFSSDPRLSTLIEYAAVGLSSSVLGTHYQEALGLKVLHWLTLEQLSIGSSAAGIGTSSGAVAGGLSSVREGGLSIVFNQPMLSQTVNNNPSYASTQFGLELLTLMRNCVGLASLNRMC